MTKFSDLPDNWSLVELGDIFSWASGKGLTQKQMSDDGEYAVYGGNGVAGFHSDWLCETESLVIGRVGAQCGNVHIAPIKSWITDNAIYASSINIPINLKYFHNLLKHRKLNELAGGSGQPYVSQSLLNPVKIPLPPLNEQRRIVSTIEQLTDRSHKARAALEDVPKLIAQFRQSVLAAAFRGDLTADWREKNPNIEPASELLERIKIDQRKRWEEAELEKMKEKSKEVLNHKWKDKYKEPEEIDISNFPDLPNGWHLAKWEQIGICQNGRAFPSNEYSLEGTKLLRPGNLHISGNVQWTESNTRYMPNDWAEKYPSHVVEGNNLVVNLTAQSLADEFLGRVCLTSKGDRCLLNQRIARLTPAIISPKFCLWLLKSPIFRRYVDKLNTGSMIQHMFTSQIDDFIFPLPPLEEQSEIVKLIEFQFKKIEQIVLLSDEISADLPGLDRSILAKAFRGELVPQDPNDEPAAVLLERIRAEREQTSSNKQRGKTTRKNSSKQLSIDLE